MKPYAGIILFLVILFGIPVCFFLRKDVEFSEQENRYLAQKPSFSFDKLRRGELSEDLEAYFSDQFPWREFWINCKTDFLRLVGKKEINGVYLGQDGYLMEKWLPESLDEELLQENIAVINDLAQSYPEMETTVMLVPTAGGIFTDKLPKNAPMIDQRTLLGQVADEWNGLNSIDLTDIFLCHREEELYYRTDHHWTSRGAFLAYQALCKAEGRSIQPEDFRREELSDSFRGSLYSKVLGNGCATDRIELYFPREEGDYEVLYHFGRTRSDSVYAYDKLNKKDQYQVFLGGNHPEITIHGYNHNRKRLLILKDSFANALVPFLLQDYETIHIIDPRYYQGNLDEYIKGHRINRCLVVYNVMQFTRDKNLSDLRVGEE